MVRLAGLSLLVFISCQFIDFSSQEREVLIRDRLVLVLCDQIDQYLSSGNLPGPVKKMPDKYKKIKPGVSGSMNGFKVVPSGGKRKRLADWDHPILDFIYE